MKDIYIFRGSPASGKGTITEAFLKEIDGKTAFLELDTFRWGFHLINRIVPDVTEDEHELAYKNYLTVLENYLSSGSYTIVTEGLFSWSSESPHGCIQDVLQLCKRYDYNAHPILLYAEYETLWQRNLSRDYSVPEEEFKSLYEHVMTERSDEELSINVGKNSIEQTVSELSSLLSN